MTAEAVAPVPARLALLVNPAAGRHDGREIDRLAEALRRLGLAVEVVVGEAPGDLARAAARLDVDTIVVAGGDGTINSVVGALVARPEPRPRLAVVAQGTANVLAHEYALPTDVDAIARALAAGRTRPLHLGLATDAMGCRRPFFLMASAGFDAAVVHAVERRVKKRFKKLAFLVTAFERGHRDLPDVDVTLTTPSGDTARVSAAVAIVAKASHYGGPFVLTRATAMDRPGLRLVALQNGSALALIAAAVRLAFGRLEGSADVVARDALRVRLGSHAEEIPVQLDGEPWGTTPIEVETSDIQLELVVNP